MHECVGCDFVTVIRECDVIFGKNEERCVQFSTFDTLNNWFLTRQKFHVIPIKGYIACRGEGRRREEKSLPRGRRWPTEDDQFLKQIARSSQFASRGRAKKWDTRASWLVSWNIHSSGYSKAPWHLHAAHVSRFRA